jgi:hypothetical protein
VYLRLSLLRLPKKARTSGTTPKPLSVQKNKGFDIELAPMWLLNADLAYYRRRLSNAVRKNKDFGKDRTRNLNYIIKTKQTIFALENEIKRRGKEKILDM